MHTRFIQRALGLAHRAAELGEVPIGAVLVRDNEVLGEGFNQCIGNSDPTAHAEIMALRASAEYLGNYRLPGTQLYVTVEPCVMCLGAIIHARVAQVIFGATEPKAGALISRPLAEQDHFNHFPEITVGPLGESCGRLMSDFFANRRLDKRGPKSQPVGL